MAVRIVRNVASPCVFEYDATGAYLVVGVGFEPSIVIASNSTQTWMWNKSLSSGQAINWSPTSTQLGNVNGAGLMLSTNSTGYSAGFFVGTSTLTNANGTVFRGVAFP